MQTIYPWHDTIWQDLTTRYLQGTLAHAFLFVGAEGLGKLDLARRFAMWLLCEKKVSQTKACATCPSCLLFLAGNHPDFMVVEPEEPSKIIKIDQIRALSDTLAQTTQRGGYKIAIINPAETMNAAASNALLKTLEEPEGQTVLILVTDRPHALPATIRSRCQKIIFQTPHPEEAKAWLDAELQSKSKANSVDLLAVAAGAPLKALALADEADFALRAQLLQDLLALRQGAASVVTLAEAYEDSDFKVIYAALISWIMHIIRLQFGDAYNSVLPATVAAAEKTSLEHLASKMNLERLFAYLDKILTLNQHLQNGISLNKQLLLEDLFLEWSGL